MNRLSIILAAGLLGTGCVSGGDTCDAHRVWISWNSFVVATDDGYATTSSCGGISQIDVYVDGDTTPISAYCADDAVAVNLLTGGHSVRVDALDGDGYPILRDELGFRISDSCADQVVDTQPGEGWVTINYDFGGGACVDGGSYMWFNVFDEIAGVSIAGVNGSSPNKAQYACNVSAQPGFISPGFALPAGDYTLDWIQEMYYADGAYHVSGAHCAPTAFSVNSGVDTSVPTLHLADATTACVQ